MLVIAKHGAPKAILEPADINALLASAQKWRQMAP